MEFKQLLKCRQCGKITEKITHTPKFADFHTCYECTKKTIKENEHLLRDYSKGKIDLKDYFDKYQQPWPI